MDIMGRNITELDKGAINRNRRKVLTAVGGCAFSIGAASTVSAGNRESETRLESGGVINCYFSQHSKFDYVYNDVKNMENSLVLLEHSEWEDDVYLRVGDVYRVSNEYAKSRFDQGATDGNLLMVAGDWTLSENNAWYTTKGRINDDKCASAGAAYKYWFHEMGHAHDLPHRDELLGQLMDPHDQTAMHMNQEECNEWNETYYISNTSNIDEDVENWDSKKNTKQHFECGPSKEDVQNFEGGSDFKKPTIKSKEPLGE